MLGVLGVLGVLGATLLQGCRVELVRPTFQDGLAPSSLQFDTSLPVSRGSIETSLAFGFAADSLEPPRVTSLAGFGGAGRRLLPPNFSNLDGFFTYCMPYERVDLPPRVKVMVWQGKDGADKATTFAIIALDVVAVTADISQKVVELLDARHPELGLSHSNVQIVASHTHSGPAGLTENPFWSAFACDRFSKPFFQFFEERVAATFSKAVRRVAPVGKTRLTAGPLKGFNRSRFKGMEVHDQYVGLDFLDAQSNGVEGCVSIFALHPTWFGQYERTLSADIPGYLERALSKRAAGAECVFLNGVEGNADISEAPSLPAYAERFAAAVRGPAPLTPKDTPARMSFSARIIPLPAPKLNWDACKVSFLEPFSSVQAISALPRTTKLSYLLLDDTLFVFFPGEPVYTAFLGIEKAIKAKYPRVARVQLLGLSNDYLGYVVGKEQYDAKTLESCSTIYGADTAQWLQDAIIAMLESNEKP